MTHGVRAVWLAFAVMIGVLVALPITSAAAPPEEHAGQSIGCSRQAGQVGVVSLKILVGTQPRTFLVQVPTAYVPSTAYPLVFVFHGRGGNSRQSYAWGLQNAAGASDAGIFVFPDGINFQNEGVGWDDRVDGHDLPFFDGMMSELGARYCIDTTRVFVAGFSWGGDFAVALACHRGDRIRAVAANSTNDEYKDTTNYLTYAGLPCATHRPPAIRFEHAERGDSEYPAPDFATTSQLFRHLNSCAATSENTRSSSSRMSCVSFNSCSSPYVECSFDEHIGHVLPPNWPQDTWDFFSGS